MLGLTLNHGGYAATSTGPMIDTAADWLTLQDVALPELGEGQVLVKVSKAAVNPSDLHFIKGEYGQPRVKGAVAGFEGCGVVQKGPDALVGKRVAFFATPDGSGAWGEYAITQARSCVPLHDGISDVDGAGQLVNPLTAMAMMEGVEGAVIITAANSQLGKLMLGLAQERGIAAIAVVRSEGAAASIARFQPAAVLQTDDVDFAAAALDVISSKKPRVMLDAVGDQATETLFTMMPRGARWVSYGKVAPEAPRLTQMGHFIFLDKKIEGFWLTQWMMTTDPIVQMDVIKNVQTRFATGQWKTDVARVVKLSDAMDALADATKEKNGKVILDMTGT